MDFESISLTARTHSLDFVSCEWMCAREPPPRGQALESRTGNTFTHNYSHQKMSSPGVEPGLSRPQRDVLTTRRWGLLLLGNLLLDSNWGIDLATMHSQFRTAREKCTHLQNRKIKRCRLAARWEDVAQRPIMPQHTGTPRQHHHV